uniref:Uncharacterized protein n=1 Tax=Anopheles atroparvus TaxID=41427 RepID=A0A182J5S2_ANOAO
MFTSQAGSNRWCCCCWCCDEINRDMKGKAKDKHMAFGVDAVHPKMDAEAGEVDIFGESAVHPLPPLLHCVSSSGGGCAAGCSFRWMDRSIRRKNLRVKPKPSRLAPREVEDWCGLRFPYLI